MPESVKPLREDVPTPGERPGIGDPVPPQRDVAEGATREDERAAARATDSEGQRDPGAPARWRTPTSATSGAPPAA